MVTSLLALFAALAWGTGDFLGGRVSKSVPSVLVVWASGAATLILTALIGLVMGIPTRLAEALTWGGLGGLAVAVGGLALYRGLSTGRMAVVTPVAGVVGAAVPVIVDLARGSSLEARVFVGIGLGMAAIWLLTAAESGAGGSGGFSYGVAAGLGFGAFFVFVASAPETSGVWPAVGAKASSVALTSALVWRGRYRVAGLRPHLLATIAVGLADGLATIAYLFATRAGMLSVAAVIASFYPAPTVILAALVLKERLRFLHWIGAGLAVAAIALITS